MQWKYGWRETEGEIDRGVDIDKDKGENLIDSHRDHSVGWKRWSEIERYKTR